MTASITDFSQFSGLRKAAGEHDPAALREVAGQFEALFIQSMLKNMREASLGDPLFGNSDQYEMYQGMMDQQLALEMSSGKGIGFADMLVRQLGPGATEKASRPDFPFSINASTRDAVQKPSWDNADEFARDVWPHAKRAARRLNVAPEAILAQAALETGWGRHVLPDRTGENSFNLFGIKTGSDWPGGQVTRQTLELKGGMLRPELARFRTYKNVAASLADYTELLSSNPRYNAVRDHGRDAAGFADALQSSGYATDPDYANKITTVLNGPTMRRVLNVISNRVVPSLNNSAAQPIATRRSVAAQ